MSERLRGALTGHVWTVLPHLRHRWRHGDAPADRPWSTTVVDPRLGPVRLTGALREKPGADTVALVVHGLGGNADAGYCLDAADAISREGWACLRINMRGADGLGQDLYHAALASDLAAAIDSPALASFRRVVVIGFSLGGHLALRYALSPDPRVHSVAAICSPLDLADSAVAFDRRRSAPYRLHVLRELKADTELRRIPVTVLTTSNRRADIDKAYELGAASYVVKPVELGKYIEIMSTIEAYWIQTVRLPTATRPR